MTAPAGLDQLRVLTWPAGSDKDLNPYTRLVFSAFDASGVTLLPFTPLMRRIPGADVFHIQWPEAIFEGRAGNILPLTWLKARRVLQTAARVRRRGGVVVLTVHNLHSHATLTGWRNRLWPRFHDALLRQVDLLVGLNPGGLGTFKGLYPVVNATPETVIPHPHYRESYRLESRRKARSALGLPATSRVITIAGSLRPSKLIPEAITAFRAMRSNELLMVAGAAANDHWTEIVEATRDEPAIKLKRGKLSNAQLAIVIAAADAVLINQSGTLNSGTALLALSLNRPVIAPAVGGMPNLANLVGPDWMQLFEPPLTPSSLRACLDQLGDRANGLQLLLDELDPFTISLALLAAYRKALEEKHAWQNCSPSKPRQRQVSSSDAHPSLD